MSSDRYVIAIGADNAGADLKNLLKRQLESDPRVAAVNDFLRGEHDLDPSNNVASAELYNPAARAFSATGALHTGRSSAAATLLPDGKVLVAGGMGNLANLASAELYNPATGRWTVTTPMHAAGYGIAGEVVDGLDFVAVRDATQRGSNHHSPSP